MSQAFMAHPISAQVLAYAATLAALSEEQLTAEFAEQPEVGEPWYGYVHDARNATLLLNLQLHQVSAELRGRTSLGHAAEICSLHQRAYRDLTGALAGIDEAVFDLEPAAGEWTLRQVLWHITGAELGFSLLIDWAVKRSESENAMPLVMPREEMEPHYDAFPETGTMSEVLGRYADLHRTVVGRLLDLDSRQLAALNVWWEGYELPVWFRMHRFDAHLREHTLQVDKTLVAIGRGPTEAERLARLLHGSLADLEIVLALVDDDSAMRTGNLVADFNTRREMLLAL